MVEEIIKTVDGNEAAADVSYAFTEVAAIYPITPSSTMAEHVDAWAAHGRLNLWGQKVNLVEMQSEAGAIGAVHGASETGALCSTYTASQGLMLMIPVMHRLAGQLKPVVMHVAARTVGTHAISISGDHSDVMGCRNTGWAMLCSGSVQECADMAAIAHLSAIKGRVPFVHFFDGFRTSHEIQKIKMLPEEELQKLVDQKALYEYKHTSLNPEHPDTRSCGVSGDLFFQSKEASNQWYDALPDIVEDYMEQLAQLTNRTYKPFDYYGPADAEQVLVAMGSVSGTICETIDAMNKKGEKMGFVQVRLYRPFSLKHFIKVLPSTVRTVTVMDRTKEPGALGDPLYEDVCTAVKDANLPISVLAARYGISGKDVPPASVYALYQNMLRDVPKNHVTLGIIDDVTHHSLADVPITVNAEGIINCKFWGYGSDGTVGANKNSIKIIGDNTDMYVQAYFEYDAKKSGGVTKSHLRFGTQPIQAEYYIKNADFLACHKEAYMHTFDIVDEIKDGGIFLLNCSWKADEVESHLSNRVKRLLAEKHIQFYIIDATHIAIEIGLGANRTNTVLQAAFFKLSNILPIDDAVRYMKAAIAKTYGNKGEKIVSSNQYAVDRGIADVVAVDVPESWKSLPDDMAAKEDLSIPEFVRHVITPSNNQKGDDVPVSEFLPYADGAFPAGTSQYEKRGVAITVPEWDAEKCIQCNRCAFVCPHAVIRPYLLTSEEKAKAPSLFVTKKATGKDLEAYEFRMQVSPLDCYSCGSCVTVCPVKALTLQPLDTQYDQDTNWKFAQTLPEKDLPMDMYSVKNSQFKRPLLEFSGACAGCAETPYMKLLTQLFGPRMVIANATGCSQAWGAMMPCLAYAKNQQGHGPAWSNSLFEDNAEFGLGMYLGMTQQRAKIADVTTELLSYADGELQQAAQQWLDSLGAANEEDITVRVGKEYLHALQSTTLSGRAAKLQQYLLAHREHIIKKVVWLYGGDGWAYDIGFGGLDHVVATDADINILIVDTEVYSNTGGQSSKATPIGAVAPFAAAGRRSNKKDLGRMLMTYGHIYIAQVAMGANPNQYIQAVKEAQAYHGPSVIIAYSPCINHGLQCGMAHVQDEMKRAVECGYWPLYRYNPALREEGKNPFHLDSKAPNGKLREFLLGENRYAALMRTFPEEAEALFQKAEAFANEKYHVYKQLAQSTNE